MTGLKAKVFQPNPEAHALYRRLHDAFGTQHGEGSIHEVMKELIGIRNQARK